MLNAYPRIIEKDLKLKMYNLALNFFLQFRDNFGCCNNFFFNFNKRKLFNF